MCFESIYEKLQKDFSFVEDYGYFFKYELKHYEFPSIVFESNQSKIRIGYGVLDYIDDYYAYFFCFTYDLTKKDGYYKGTEILNYKPTKNISYKKQLDEAKEKINKYLQEHSTN